MNVITNLKGWFITIACGILLLTAQEIYGQEGTKKIYKMRREKEHIHLVIIGPDYPYFGYLGQFRRKITGNENYSLIGGILGGVMYHHKSEEQLYEYTNNTGLYAPQNAYEKAHVIKLHAPYITLGVKLKFEKLNLTFNAGGGLTQTFLVQKGRFDLLAITDTTASILEAEDTSTDYFLKGLAYANGNLEFPIGDKRRFLTVGTHYFIRKDASYLLISFGIGL